jgi:hypothetical protein
VALAAIQGLYQTLQEQEAQITTLQQQNAALEARLSALEQAMSVSRPSQSSLPSGWLLLGGLVVAAVLVGQRRFAGGGR